MAISGAAIVGALYFFLNTIALFVMGYYVYVNIYLSTPNAKKEGVITYFWARRRIFSTLIVMFLDAGTDISVLINWYILMDNESSDSIDYESINMASFFWPLLGFFILYNIIMLFIACDSSHICDLPLVIFQLFPFRAGYISLIDSHDPSKNKSKEEAKGDEENATKKNLEKAISSEEQAEEAEDAADNDKEPEYKGPYAQTEHIAFDYELADEINETCIIQDRMLLIHGTLETLPALVLQSVFWVKSFNDPILIKDNSSLVVFSVIASLVSVSARYVVFVDAPWINVGRGSCLKVWYWISIIYRVLSILASFIVFVMLWVVVGGIWLLFWTVVSLFIWKAATYRNGDGICSAPAFGNAVRNMIALTLEYRWPYHLIKFIQDIIGMIIIVAFLYTSFDCGDSKACVSGETRKSYQESNNRIAFLFLLGWIAAFVQFLIYVVMHQMGKIKAKEENNGDDSKPPMDKQSAGTVSYKE